METWLEVILHFAGGRAGGAARDVPLALNFPRAGKMFGEVLERCNYSRLRRAGERRRSPSQPQLLSRISAAPRLPEPPAAEGSPRGWGRISPVQGESREPPPRHGSGDPSPNPSFWVRPGFGFQSLPFRSVSFPRERKSEPAPAFIPQARPPAPQPPPRGGSHKPPIPTLPQDRQELPDPPKPRFPRGVPGVGGHSRAGSPLSPSPPRAPRPGRDPRAPRGCG